MPSDSEIYVLNKLYSLNNLHQRIGLLDYDLSWTSLNSKLRSSEDLSGGLSDALLELENHQRESGFIVDDLRGIQRFVFSHPTKDYSFRVQLNPKRARRHDGTGILQPPRNETYLNDGCFLCRKNIKWQQEGRQIGFEIKTQSGDYNALMNPFPLMPNHVVLASREHIPQEVELLSDDQHGKRLEELLEDLCELACRLPKHVGFYNGVGAGASIASHFHLQFFRRLADIPNFPIEERSFTSSKDGRCPEFILDYPIHVLRWRGSISEVVSKAYIWITQSIKEIGISKHRLTSNFIATSSELGENVTLYFIPRDKENQFWNGGKGIVGGLEILGELVMASKDERTLINKGKIDYFFINYALSNISTQLSN